MNRNGETCAERGSEKPSLACQELATTGGAPWRLQCAHLNYFNRPVRTRMPSGVGGERPQGRPLSRFRERCSRYLRALGRRLTFINTYGSALRYGANAVPS